MRFSFFLLFVLLHGGVSALAQQSSNPPRENPYDVVGKAWQPFIGTLVGGKGVVNNAVSLRITIREVSGRLPSEMSGATLTVGIEYPDKIKLTAPVLGEMVTVCRNGDAVWATPGSKVQFLLKRFPIKLEPTAKPNSPLALPISPMQAALLPALLNIKNTETAEIVSWEGQDYRVITASLNAEVAKAIKYEDFQIKMWIAPGYALRRLDIRQSDFTVTAEISALKFLPQLPASTWVEPAETSDIYRVKSDFLDAILFVVINSLKLDEGTLGSPR